jgi:DNA-binding PadR family transcriptional regulator
LVETVSTGSDPDEAPMKAAPREFLPLPVSEFSILLTLIDGARHGYAIMTEVAERTAGEVELGPGTLYGAVKRMLASRLIAEAAAPSADDDPRRRYYDITPLGREVVRAEAARMARLVRQARDKRVLGRLETA